MKKDMVAHLFELYFRFDPDFQKIMDIEYPKLAAEDQLRLLKLLSEDFHGVVENLSKLEPKTAVASA